MLQATVGAGLPVISTLQGLLRTGDKVKSIEGILSGTLSYIFNNFGSGKRFSDVVTQAKAAGYTEPDPREDLSGRNPSPEFSLSNASGRNLAHEQKLPCDLAF